MFQIKRVTGATPDPAKIGGVTFMLTINQTSFDRSQVISVEKVGNNFDVIYIHDTNNEGGPCIAGLRFVDENVDVGLGGVPQNVADKYIGKFDLGGVAKHVFLQ